jgi:DeoR/GlpR family transcriptional regulator of sugar metabolism
MMIPLKRRQTLLNSLSEKEVLSIAELTGLLGVSHMTVRRDIQKLEQEGRVQSITGGVQLSQKITSEPSHIVKRTLQQREKEAIAKLAASLVSPGQSLYLDAGTTSLSLAEFIAEIPDLVVISNDLAVVNLLIHRSKCRLYHTGGLVLRENRSCVGDNTTQFLNNLNLDLAFLSASSWNARWTSTPTEIKVSAKKAALSAAAKRILICDSSKYGKVGIFNAFALKELDIVITDDGLPENAREAVLQNGINLMIAETGNDDESGSRRADGY